MEVLRGASDSLPVIRALQAEASIFGIYKGMPGYMDTLRYLDEHGFDITGFYPVSRNSALRLIEFDCDDQSDRLRRLERLLLQQAHSVRLI